MNCDGSKESSSSPDCLVVVDSSIQEAMNIDRSMPESGNRAVPTMTVASSSAETPGLARVALSSNNVETPACHSHPTTA